MHPIRLKYAWLLAVLLIGASDAKTTTSVSLASKPALVSKSASALSIPSSELASTSAATNAVVGKTIPRGGDGEDGGMAQRLKIGSYFALWYILNIVYNSKCIVYDMN